MAVPGAVFSATAAGSEAKSEETATIAGASTSRHRVAALSALAPKRLASRRAIFRERWSLPLLLRRC
jgi:hypothetical protein